MDINIEQQIKELVESLRNNSVGIDDPIAKLMLTTLAYQAESITDEIKLLPQRIAERLCDLFIPHDKLTPIPAIALVQATARPGKNSSPKHVSDNAVFSYKKVNAKNALCYKPVFKSLVMPYERTHIVSSQIIKPTGAVSGANGRNGQLWLGIETDIEIDNLEGLSMLIKGTHGLSPQHIYVENGMKELSFSTIDRMEDIQMLEPFDAQQSSREFFPIVNEWKCALRDMDDACFLYLTDRSQDRDIFKKKAYPKAFQQILESSDLDKFTPNTLWLLLDFGQGYEIPRNVEVLLNVMPVANVNVNSVTLTQSSPIAKLSKGDGTAFVCVQQTSSASYQQGFSKVEDEVVIRDFDASAYNNESLFIGVRSLYNHFIDDYHAFLSYNGVRDGETIRLLRETINNIGKSVNLANSVEDRFDSGVYAMRNTSISAQNSSIKVSYITTNGKQGNAPTVGCKLENRKEPAIEKEVVVVVDAMCGDDKPNVDMRHELLRYYTLTEDRLYTKMDIDAFLRKEILSEFGKEEYARISFTINIEGAAGERRLQRGLYVDVMFKDKVNYLKAQTEGFDRKLQQRIGNRSCISMPIIVALKCLEE